MASKILLVITALISLFSGCASSQEKRSLDKPTCEYTIHRLPTKPDSGILCNTFYHVTIRLPMGRRGWDGGRVKVLDARRAIDFYCNPPGPVRRVRQPLDGAPKKANNMWQFTVIVNSLTDPHHPLEGPNCAVNVLRHVAQRRGLPWPDRCVWPILFALMLGSFRSEADCDTGSEGRVRLKDEWPRKPLLRQMVAWEYSVLI